MSSRGPAPHFGDGAEGSAFRFVGKCPVEGIAALHTVYVRARPISRGAAPLLLFKACEVLRIELRLRFTLFVTPQRMCHPPFLFVAPHESECGMVGPGFRFRKINTCAARQNYSTPV